MDIPDDDEKQMNLTCDKAEELAFQSLQDDAESLVLLLEGIKEHKPLEAEMLIIFAVNKIFCLTNDYNAMKADYCKLYSIGYGRSRKQRAGGINQTSCLLYCVVLVQVRNALSVERSMAFRD